MTRVVYSRSDHDVAPVHDAGLHDLRCGDRRGQGQLDGAVLRQQHRRTQDASTNTNSDQFIKSEIPLRPRVLTLGFGYKF